ncbi:MAG: alpha/beta hydrolase [Candidatus Thorarchaeota archaeon]|nr:alpha/beta hydrolase [Candidatus Thorarchaeota archaeon]
MPFFEYQGKKMHYVDLDQRKDTSAGMPLVFVHGAGSSLMIWTLQLLEFRKTHRVIALDLYGHGDSEDIGHPPDIEKGFTGQIATLMDHLDIEEFVLAGHSMGGGVVMSYALRDDVRQPSALILVGTSSDLDLSKIGIGLVIESLEDHTPKYDIEEISADFKTFSLANFQENVTKFHPATILNDLRACHEFDVTARLSEIEIPSFVMVGEDDDIITPHVANRLDEALPRSDIAVVKGGDHSPMVESPEPFNHLLRKFVNWVEKNKN